MQETNILGLFSRNARCIIQMSIVSCHSRFDPGEFGKKFEMDYSLLYPFSIVLITLSRNIPPYRESSTAELCERKPLVLNLKLVPFINQILLIAPTPMSVEGGISLARGQDRIGNFLADMLVCCLAFSSLPPTSVRPSAQILSPDGGALSHSNYRGLPARFCLLSRQGATTTTTSAGLLLFTLDCIIDHVFRW